MLLKNFSGIKCICARCGNICSEMLLKRQFAVKYVAEYIVTVKAALKYVAHFNVTGHVAVRYVVDFV